MSPAFRRRRALIRKEFHQIVRDPSSLAMAFLLPLILLFLFGYGVSLDIEHVPVGVVMETDAPGAEAMLSSLANKRYFTVTRFTSAQEGLTALTKGEVLGILRISQDFTRLSEGGRPAPLQLLVDGVDANTARVIEGYVEGAAGIYEGWQAANGAQIVPPPFGLDPRIWFNPELESRYFLVPGLIAIIMTVIGTLLTALVVAREWERGTMEALLATPMTRFDLLLSKTVPYFCLGMGGMTVSVIVARALFHVPLRGSLLVLFGSAGVFMLSALGLGLLISTLTRNQFVAGQTSLIAGYLPAFILSGFIYDLRSMPDAIEWLSHIVAARYFVAILQSEFLAGSLGSVIWPNLAGLAVLALLLYLLTARVTRKTLD